MNGFDLSTIIDAKLGATTLSSIYLGSNKLWPTIPPDPYSLIPVTIENISDNNVTLTVTGYGNRRYELYYSWPFFKDEYPPSSYDNSHSIYGDTYDFATLIPGQMIRLWAKDNRAIKSQNEYYSITSDGPINIYGNVKSLLDMNNEGYSSMGRYCLTNYFNGSMVVDASHLVLPDTTLSVGCYFGMFKNCTYLTAVPKLPATTLATSCYQTMFASCPSLVTVPADLLPATTLASGCYRSMFDRCTSLTTAPILPATKLKQDCYRSMFYNDSALTYIKAMFTTTPSEGYTKTWVYGVSATGTYVKNSAASYTNTGDSAIPSGWTVQTASS